MRPGVIARALPRWWWVGALALLLAMAHGRPVSAGALHVVGVVDFYTSGPTPAISGPPPGQFAADDLAKMLPNVARGPLKVIPRKVMRETEASMKWHSGDGLQSDRLIELARRVGADHLILGRIERFQVEQDSSGIGGPKYRVTAAIRVQVFGAVERHFIGDAPGTGFARGPSLSAAGQQALHQAVSAALPHALANLTPAH